MPLVASVVEFRKQALIVRQVAEEVFRERQITVPFLLGTMIELPRAALTADEMAREAQFFSFGTNDLTQTTWGLRRDDAGHFLPYYLEHGVIEDDPFQVLDIAGVGKLIADGRRAGPPDARPTSSSASAASTAASRPRWPSATGSGMNYVSCSPFRVPIARLAAAQAALATRGTMDRTRATVSVDSRLRSFVPRRRVLERVAAPAAIEVERVPCAIPDEACAPKGASRLTASRERSRSCGAP